MISWGLSRLVPLYSKKITRIYLVCGLLALVLIPTSAAAKKSPVTIALERVPDADPKALILRATSKNDSGHNIIIGSGGPLMDYEIVATNAEHVPVPFSKEGERVFSKDRIRSTMYVAVTLKPEETIVDTWHIEELFDFVRPGRYFIKVTRNVGTGIAGQVVSSNVLQVSLK